MRVREAMGSNWTEAIFNLENIGEMGFEEPVEKGLRVMLKNKGLRTGVTYKIVKRYSNELEKGENPSAVFEVEAPDGRALMSCRLLDDKLAYWGRTS